jgi:outer membrane protein TolC
MKAFMKYFLIWLPLFFGATDDNTANAQSMEEYLQIAAENNPGLKAAYAEFEASLQQAPQMASLPDPTLTMSAFGRMIETRLGAQEARFSLMQMFPWFGTLQAKEEVAVLMAEARFREYLAHREKLFLEVKSSYAEIYAVTETIKVQEENLKILDSYRELALSRFKSGDAPMVNVLQTDIQIEAARTEIELMGSFLKPLETNFNALLNRNPGTTVQIKDTLLIEPALLSGMEPAFDRHPEISGLEKQRQSFESRQKVADKEGMPMVGLGLDYSIISRRTDADPAGNGQDAIMPMLSVSLPIFRKKYKAAKKEAEFMAEKLEYEIQAQSNELYSRYEMAAYEFKKAQRLMKLYESQIETSLQARRLLVSGFRNATVDFQEVLQMNQNLLMFQTQKIESLKNAFTAQANLKYLFSNTENDENK